MRANDEMVDLDFESMGIKNYTSLDVDTLMYICMAIKKKYGNLQICRVDEEFGDETGIIACDIRIVRQRDGCTFVLMDGCKYDQ